MSTLAQVRFTCPTCGQPCEGEIGVVVQLNKRRDLEQALVDRRFNVVPCGCGARNEIVRTVICTDFVARWWLQCWPGWAELHWKDLAAATSRQFRRTLTALMPEEADRWQVRAVFGYEQLREKVVLIRAGLDDRAVEVGKGKLLAGRPDRVGARILVDEVEPDALRMRIVGAAGAHELHRVPLTLLDPAKHPAGGQEVELAPGWTSAELLADPFVSFRRWLVAPRPADPLAFDLHGVSADRGQTRTTWDDTDPVT